MTEALRQIQNRLNAPKNQYNNFGKYAYRSCESILEAVKPLLSEYGAEVVLTDNIKLIGDRFYVEATAIFTCGEDEVVVTAYAREPETKKGMDESQITGTASSYARKYALNGLFLIDDSKDADTDEYRNETHRDEPRVEAKQIQQLTDLADEKGVSLMAICERFNLNSIQDMTKPMFVKAVRMLEATKPKNEVA